MMHTEDMTEPYAIIRRKHGEVDDVAISCDAYRLERMDTNLVWVCCYRDGKQVAFFIRVTGRSLSIELSTDELSCTDDSEGG